ncbi:roadblock/LC7 domain-containing protein [Acinetobacter sp. S40]|uniref:roadblock/LC7 domain-containing protein n=1 Tax=unclassified Acinetobacter TaxID=196816 RepID=UPI00190D9DC0|nr:MULTISPECIES: roadblock/LC7 domain-containing protein [unclassified Acinetobacter]MBJ9986354.1 roadblock/LC7 domain-containing protein [Acinetobacter sp. S40]MBK0064419.1 roadblock/LC7 domain-containing protein [Acinetobacter sp. S55]MBK0067776.1 roadblock/LC7 domain-containing protein [Acinetobacter sp. S54]
MFALKEQRRIASPELIQHAKNEVQDIINNVRGIDFIMLCSTDGFELATITKKNHYNASKLAAVSSSILAMVGAFLKEIQLTGCQSITLDAENGKAILTSVPADKHPMVIVTLSSKDVLLGQLLFSLKKASQNIISHVN